MTRKIRSSAPELVTLCSRCAGTLDESARLGVPDPISHLYTGGAAQEVERVVVGVVMQWRSAARAELRQLRTEQRGVVGADQLVADPEVLAKVGLMPDDVVRREHIWHHGVAVAHGDCSFPMSAIGAGAVETCG